MLSGGLFKYPPKLQMTHEMITEEFNLNDKIPDASLQVWNSE